MFCKQQILQHGIFKYFCDVEDNENLMIPGLYIILSNVYQMCNAGVFKLSKEEAAFYEEKSWFLASACESGNPRDESKRNQILQFLQKLSTVICTSSINQALPFILLV